MHSAIEIQIGFHLISHNFRMEYGFWSKNSTNSIWMSYGMNGYRAHHFHYGKCLSDYTQLEIVVHFEQAHEDTYAHYANTRTPRPIHSIVPAALID